METSGSLSEAQQPYLPPGFRFHPTDEELVTHYLKRKVSSLPIPAEIITEINLYLFDPWELPEKASFGEKEWYFFSPRERKYPNGTRPNRAATSGYWKATGTDKPIVAAGDGEKVGVKKALVFYSGKPPKGTKTNWIMHEYRLVDGNSGSSSELSRKKLSLRLDDWVLCRIYKKNASNKTEGDANLGSNNGLFTETFFDGGASVSQLASPSPGSAEPQPYWMSGQDFLAGYKDVHMNDQDYGHHSEDANSLGSNFSSSSLVGDGVLRRQYQLANIKW